MHRLNLEGSPKRLRSWFLEDRRRNATFPCIPSLTSVSHECIICLIVDGIGDITLLFPIPGHPPWVWWLPEVTTLLDKKAFPFLEDGEDDARLNEAGRTGHQRRCWPLSSSLCHTAPSANIPPEGRALAAGSDLEAVSNAPSLPSFLTAH